MKYIHLRVMEFIQEKNDARKELPYDFKRKIYPKLKYVKT